MHNKNNNYNNNYNNNKNSHIEINNKQDNESAIDNNNDVNNLQIYENDIKENIEKNNDTIGNDEELKNDSNMAYSDLSNNNNDSENPTDINESVDKDDSIISTEPINKQGRVSIYSSNGVNMRKEPNYSSDIIYVLHDSDQVEILDEIKFNSSTRFNEYSYLKIKYNDAIGYCLKRYINIL